MYQLCFSIFSHNRSIKLWHEFKREPNLHEFFSFQWLQIIDSIPQRWEMIIFFDNSENAINLIIDDHHLVKDSRVITLDKLTSAEIYSILIPRAQNKPSSNTYFENLYNDYNIGGTAIYTLPRLITNSTYMRSFQHKISNNVLFVNKKLHTFGIKPSPLCSFCNLYDKTPYHMFYECDHAKYFQNNLILPTLTRQTAIFEFLDYTNNDSFFSFFFLKTINALATTFY